jgi:hypothetical protein
MVVELGFNPIKSPDYVIEAPVHVGSQTVGSSGRAVKSPALGTLRD